MGNVLLFHVNVFQVGQIASVCQKLGHQVQMVDIRDYQNTLGAILKKPLFQKNADYQGKDFAHEMMVFSEFSSEELDLFLEAYKKAQIAPIPRKSVVTPYNIVWTPLKLYQELDEHQIS